MGSMCGADASHVRVGPGEYIDVTKKNMLQLFFLFFGQEGANISVFFGPLRSIDSRGFIANRSLSSEPT